MQDWKNGAAAVLLHDGNGRLTIVLNPKALGKDSKEVTRAFARAFNDRLHSRDPKFYRDFHARWQDAYWNTSRYNSNRREYDPPTAPNPTEYFVDSFTSYVSDGGQELHKQNGEAARLMRTAVEALAGSQ